MLLPDHPIALRVHFDKFPRTDRLDHREMAFHVSRAAREKYQFDETLFTTSGNVIFANFYAARVFAQKINQKRDIINHPEQACSAAELNALGLIDEILHNIIRQYREQINGNVFNEAIEQLQKQFAEDKTDGLLLRFIDEFPPTPVYNAKMTPREYLAGTTDGVSNRELVLEELLVLWLANQNPAFDKFRELFDDTLLQKETVYKPAVQELISFFDDQPWFGPGQNKMSLIDLLLQPGREAGGSLSEQLRFIRLNWGMLLEAMSDINWRIVLGDAFIHEWGLPPDEYEVRMLRNLDYISEEQKQRFNPASGEVETHVPDFSYEYDEPEQFSADLDWMPRLVLLAKCTLVWLDQLSKQYEREIRRLDEVPDEELDMLAGRGFTGLWLIGLWERSKASKRIKHLTGNSDAEASAYSLEDYQIAQELGGEEAYIILRDRCWQRGIRLGSDMVPNHTGIDSRLMMERPDWFIQLPYPPFPSYTFNGVNLSNNPHVGIYLEDHYYDRTDASVVFKRVDNHSGETRFIYHGNDGTSMPWNDTAQLNYLIPEVREEIIQTILRVARLSPIIRFDAAMTLAKKHFQRLWYPQPGSGGDIPSRAEHGLTFAHFNELIPIEFWREVVDRVAEESPDTLLLAEAFWMMEGYFVRTLGMHRVYNSAFMNMLKKEENKKYRYTIKNTLEFEPEVLKRYVNFMNNPDEDTAIEQFGDGDKYFGVCILMSTLPGLPMFGHGQVEGYREKYGMEFKRAYWDETPNQWLIDRHAREIFPLLKKRYLFAEVEHFLLYDFYLENGSVDENVFAYSNRFGDERALVVFNNAYSQTSGWIRRSAAFSSKNGGSDKSLVQRNLGDGLQLPIDANSFVIFRDQISGLEYIRSSREIWDHGFRVELGAYKYHVYIDFRFVADSISLQYGRLNTYLNGRGVPSIDEALHEMYVQPIHQSFTARFDKETLTALWQRYQGDITAADIRKTLKEFEVGYKAFLKTAVDFEKIDTPNLPSAAKISNQLSELLKFTGKAASKNLELGTSAADKRLKQAIDEVGADKQRFAVLCYWLILRDLGHLALPKKTLPGDYLDASRQWMHDWRLRTVIVAQLQNWGLADDAAHQAVDQVQLLLTLQKALLEIETAKESTSLLRHLFATPAFQAYSGVNQFEETVWFNKEAFSEICNWLPLVQVFEITANQQDGKSAKEQISKSVNQQKSKSAKPQTGKAKVGAAGKSARTFFAMIEKWQKAAEKSEYQVEKLFAAAEPAKKPRSKAASKAKKAVKPARAIKKKLK